jgi:hypothetical protein
MNVLLKLRTKETWRLGDLVTKAHKNRTVASILILDGPPYKTKSSHTLRRGDDIDPRKLAQDVLITGTLNSYTLDWIELVILIK